MKRAIDVGGASALLVITAPVSTLTALAIALTMGRPVLFRQRRPGLNGEPFEIRKFRTMRLGDGSDAERLTKLGRLLRSASIDELPQLINVLRGEMSLVGPRPLLPEYLELYTPRQASRHRVPPGITGLAQVCGRNDLDWACRLELDAQYAEHRSLRLDLAILWRTLRKTAEREGVSAVGEATVRRFAGAADPSFGARGAA